MRKIMMVVVLSVMAGGAYAADFSELGVNASDLKGRIVAEGVIMPPVSKGYVAGNDPSTGVPSKPVEWVSIPGGKFTMGTDDLGDLFTDAKPIHEVSIMTFKMSKTDVTVEQYAECVIKGKCEAPGIGGSCNWGVPGRQTHPVNCVSFAKALQYAEFKHARLPSESEWEYSATSGGRNQMYPWGNAEPTRDLVVASANFTSPVCSKPAGNTAQGLCDMAGNVWQWVEDVYVGSYAHTPVDGSAYEGWGDARVMRGGSIRDYTAEFLRADLRNLYRYGDRPDIGFRLAI